MDSQTLNTVVRRLRHAVDPAARQSDGELLHLFVKRRDATAFAEIIRRHGPMVLGVCRRVLRHSVDADDAFQATFLVLIRRADSLRSPDQLAGWLHQVALRTSRKLLAVRLARQKREGELFDVPSGEEPAEVIWRELRPLFDEELGRMPDKLRLPAVLCFLEGLSKSEAARVLGWPEGTVSGRLQRARERLRLRFAARGLTLSSGALALSLFEGLGSAAVSPPLFESALQLIAQPTLASGAVQTLANGVTQAMFITKTKTIAAAVLMVGIVSSGTGVLLVPGNGPSEVVAADTPKETPSKPPAAAKAKDEPAADVPKAPKPNDKVVRSYEETIKQLEMIVQKTEDGFKKGIIPEKELLNSQATLASYKLELVKIREESKLDAPKTPDPRRAALDATIKSQLEAAIKAQEQDVEQTSQGVARGIVPRTELVQAQLGLHELKLKLLEVSNRVAGDPEVKAASNKERLAIIALKESELAQAESPLRRKVASLEEIRRLRIELGRLRAEAALSEGDFQAVITQRELVAKESEAIRDERRLLVERRAASQGELRKAQAALTEAKIEILRAEVRKQLADIVAIREQELREAKTLFEAKAISVEEFRNAERSLAEAKLRLAEGR